MKTLAALALILTSSPAFASLPVFNCHNPATGADFYAAFYAGRVAFTMNNVLTDVLLRQGVSRRPNDFDVEGKIDLHAPNGPTFSLPTSAGLLKLEREGAGYRMHVENGANFYFNPGECHVWDNI